MRTLDGELFEVDEVEVILCPPNTNCIPLSHILRSVVVNWHGLEESAGSTLIL